MTCVNVFTYQNDINTIVLNIYDIKNDINIFVLIFLQQNDIDL